jgi:hypothetical protein
MILRSALRRVEGLSVGDRDAMFRLMEKTYVNKQRDRFDADLDAKQWAIFVRRPEDDRIVGFSTQTLLEIRVLGERVTALYSGDTVVDRDYWGDPALAHAWGNFAISLIDRHPIEWGPFYWFLTSKGFRTYHYLPLFFREYFPRLGVQTPSFERSIINALGGLIGGDRFDAQHAVIRADSWSDFVRPEILEPASRRKTDVRARFFAGCNPNYARGDELCCLAPLSRANFSSAAYRIIELRRASAQAV